MSQTTDALKAKVAAWFGSLTAAQYSFKVVAVVAVASLIIGAIVGHKL